VQSSQQSSSFLAPLPGTKEEYLQRKKKKLQRQLHASTYHPQLTLHCALMILSVAGLVRLYVFHVAGDHFGMNW
jgi:hypothetical protein